MKLDVIYNEDCIEGMQKYIPNNSIDLIITDPPYGISKKGKFEIPEKRYKRIYEKWDTDIEDITRRSIKECYRVLKEGSCIYVFASFHNLRLVWDALENAGFIFRNNIVIIKTNAMPIKFAMHIGVYAYSHVYVLYFSKGAVKTFNYKLMKEINGGKQMRDYKIITIKDRASNKGKHKHPSIKDLSLIKSFIIASSKKGDVVLDPFLGSGTTAIGCAQLERHYIGFENKLEYYNLAQKSLSEVQTEIFT